MPQPGMGPDLGDKTRCVPSRAPFLAVEHYLVINKQVAPNALIEGVGQFRSGGGGRRRLGPCPALRAGDNNTWNHLEGRIRHSIVFKDAMRGGSLGAPPPWMKLPSGASSLSWRRSLQRPDCFANIERAPVC
eukprot:7838046-Alexandrium_andersonii.AAC.1